MPTAQTKDYGEPLTLSSNTPVRTGYTFKGWAESSSATVAQYPAGGTFTKNTNAVLYAVWQSDVSSMIMEWTLPQANFRVNISINSTTTSSSNSSLLTSLLIGVMEQ